MDQNEKLCSGGLGRGNQRVNLLFTELSVQAFCAFDDYNWDWSLHNIGMTCIPNKLKVMVSKSPRIYHIGEWSVMECYFFYVDLAFELSLLKSNPHSLSLCYVISQCNVNLSTGTLHIPFLSCLVL